MKAWVRTFEHMHWANGLILEALRSQQAESERALALFAHIASAERVWLERLQGTGNSATPIWPTRSLEECATLVEQNHQGYANYVHTLTESDLSRSVHYANSQGQPFATQIGDILAQVALHGSYHRGQIALLLRLEGLKPPGTDYITFVRSL